ALRVRHSCAPRAGNRRSKESTMKPAIKHWTLVISLGAAQALAPGCGRDDANGLDNVGAAGGPLTLEGVTGGGPLPATSSAAAEGTGAVTLAEAVPTLEATDTSSG